MTGCDGENLFLCAGSYRLCCAVPPKRQTGCPRSRCPHTPPPIRFTGSWSWPDDGRDRSAWQCSRRASTSASLSLSLIELVGASLPCTRSSSISMSRISCNVMQYSSTLKVFILLSIYPEVHKCMSASRTFYNIKRYFLYYRIHANNSL